MVEVCGYRFDLVIVRVDAPNFTFDQANDLDVDVRFHNFDLKVTSSRINVVEFPAERSHEFVEEVNTLCASMEQNPLTLGVNYMGSSIGMGQMFWPDNVMADLKRMQEVVHLCDVDLTQEEEEGKAGTVSIIVRIQPKCREMREAEGEEVPGDSEINQIEKTINSQDVIFVVGDPYNVPGCMGVSLKVDTTKDNLNLSNLRPLHGTNVSSPDVLNTCCNLDCCGLRQIANEYSENIVNRMTCRYSKGKYVRQQQKAKAKCIKCDIEENDGEHEQEKKHDNCACRPKGSGMMGIMSGPGGREPAVFAPPKSCTLAPPAPLKIERNSPPRRCPVCNANHEWLPKMAACPQCCFKPMPFVEECPCVENLTADEILREYLDREQSSLECQSDYSNNEETECRCTCQVGRICPYCRIRKACENVFPPDFNPDNNQMYQNKGKLNKDQILAENSEEDCRPFLVRVFSELKDLYDIRDDVQIKKDDLDCARRLGGGEQKTFRKKYNTGKSYDEPSTACKDMEAIRQNMSNRKASRETKNCRKTMCAKFNKTNRTQCGIKVPKVKLPQCGGCNPLGRLPCKQKQKHPCGNNEYDYCAAREPAPISSRHNLCVDGRKNVPCHMGWLWNTDPRVAKSGWKPGAIRKSIRQLMSYFLRDFPADTLIVSKYCYRKPPKKKIEHIEQQTTLHICKRNDEYFVTFRPLKDAEALQKCADPYLEMKPIQFKITKDPMLTELSKLKRCLKTMGFTKCTCHQPVNTCHCRSFVEKKRLEFEMNKLCRKRELPDCGEKLVLTDTSDSECEYDFGVTPPAGIVKRSRLYKPDMVDQGSQYVEDDWNIKPLFPKKLNKYGKNYKCATGERKKKDPPEKRKKKKKPQPAGSKGEQPAPLDAREAKIADILARNPKLAKLLGKDGKMDMMRYLKMCKPMDPEERRRKLQMLKEMAAPPLDSLARRGKPDPCVCVPCCAPCCAPYYDACYRPC